ncbi:hypothetical protein BN873_540016 [Candidatus Competibacter denitrificans Run_A_D11]|uniref:Uncharacterized protein n=1 Tax=Candidatus Competibacter denitrificans Run_A_D11 TaxID=1400863 RepID=W6M6K3_9GAMM|nr:hypothetical protein BN873_540016 [Candidatus Competibacter denitrificans Run_A_D11]
MPRRSILSATERESLLALPDAKDDLIRYVQRNRPIGDSSAARACESAGLRCSALLLAIPRRHLGR